MYRAILKKHIEFLVDQYGADYYIDAMNLGDEFPRLSTEEQCAYYEVLAEIMRERHEAVVIVRPGLC